MATEPSTLVSAIKVVLNPVILHGLTLALLLVIILEYFSINVIPSDAHQYKLLALIVFISLEVSYFSVSDKSALTKLRKRQRKLRVLKNLTDKEKQLLRALVAGTTGLVEAHTGLDARLENHGIIFRTSPMMFNILVGENYRVNIEDESRSYLIKHPSLLE